MGDPIQEAREAARSLVVISRRLSLQYATWADDERNPERRQKWLGEAKRLDDQANWYECHFHLTEKETSNAA